MFRPIQFRPEPKAAAVAGAAAVALNKIMKKIYFIVIIIIIVSVIGGIVYIKSQKKIVDAGQLLDKFLSSNQTSSEVQEAYHFALANPDNILSQMPCYCGCIQRGVHKNNRDCFINEDARGNDYFDKMGLNCGTCIDIALAVKNLYGQGKSAQEIKDVITNKFKGTL